MKIVWLSAGVSSFIAGYLVKDTVDEWIYIDIDNQHPDSMRFIKDCEKVLGKRITILKSDEFNSVQEVIRKFRCINTPYGSPCTGMLKKKVRKKWESEHLGEELTYVWGMDANEIHRAEMLLEIDKRMPEEEQIGDYLKVKEVMIDELAVGDEIVWIDWNGNVNINTILGIGEKDKIVNGHDVEGVPYMDYYNRIEGNPANNCNNYLINKNFRLYKKFIES